MIDLLLQDGDLVFTKRDFGINGNEISGNASIAQTIFCRLKSCSVDWFYDRVGADLEQIIGEPNTEENANLGSSLIISSLTYDGFLSEDKIVVKPIPQDEFTILYYLVITLDDGEELKYEVNLALNSGISIRNLGDLYA